MIRERKLYLLTLVSIVTAATKSNVEVHEASSLSENGEGNRNDDVFMDSDTCILDLKGNITGRIPSELFLEITIHYEETFLFASNGSHEAALADIQELLTHAQAYFYDASLQTKIHLKVRICSKYFVKCDRKLSFLFRSSTLHFGQENTSLLLNIGWGTLEIFYEITISRKQTLMYFWGIITIGRRQALRHPTYILMKWDILAKECLLVRAVLTTIVGQLLKNQLGKIGSLAF